MRKIVIASDSHMRPNILEKIEEMHPDADDYILCGDSSLPKKNLGKFISVTGNHDYVNYPNELELEIEGNKILVTHGHLQGIWYGNIEGLVDYAKNKKVDMVFYGHTHVYMDETISGIRFLNPGSIFFNRDMSDPSFMYLEMDGKNITITKETIPYQIGE